MTIVVVTKKHSEKQMSEYISRQPNAKMTAPATRPTISGPAKFRFRLSREVFRQARSGPTPVRKSRNRPIGTLTLLKNGAPTLILEPETASERTGKRVPERTAMQETSRIKLLNRKLDSRETIASNWLSLFK